MTPLQISSLPNDKFFAPVSSSFPMALQPESESATLLPIHLPPPAAPGPDSDSDEERAYEPSEKIAISGDDASDPESDSGDAPPFSWRKLWLFTGPGFLMSIGFLDPGNLEGDLQAGAIAGYSLLWLLMWATAMGLLIQMLSARLGVATGKHLAEVCRDEYPTWARLALWSMAEVALIGADIQEVIGSAIAIKILSGGVMPLWAGVVITALDCFMFLFLENYGVRKLEAMFAVLIATMAISFAWMFGETKPDGKELLIGLLVPKIGSKTIRQAVGVVGCVIMPHNVFLHSALVQSRKVDNTKKSRVREALYYYSIESTVALIISFGINLCVTTVFAKGFYGSKQADSIGLENAGQFLQDKYGGGVFPILYIWGIGLLAAGQSSTITGTYAGQFIMGGFLNLRLKKWIRALITRSFAIVPTMVVALFFDTSDETLDVLNEWLNVLQSVQIPFALIPLLTLVSKEHVMGVFRIGKKIKVFKGSTTFLLLLIVTLAGRYEFYTNISRTYIFGGRQRSLIIFNILHSISDRTLFWVLMVVTWIVATLLIIINAYLLLDFISAEVRGLLYGLMVGVTIVLYAIFVLYLILRDGELPNQLASAVHKSFS